MEKLRLPTRTETRVCEARGVKKEFQVEDRPFRLIKGKFNEVRGEYQDVEEPLTDMEIAMVGGVETFFSKDGKRVACNWPWSGEDKRTRKAAPKKAAKKKAKKRASKKR